MTLDFLGVDPSNAIIGEEPYYRDGIIVPKRGFFFSDTVHLYDAEGNELDINGYSFDLPEPVISASIGRMVFGRIIMNSTKVPVTIDYKTPYYEEDNRYADIDQYCNNVSLLISNDYYNHNSRIFKSGMSKMEGSDTDMWLSSLDNLIDTWRSRNLDYDIILDAIDDVFTKGLVRNPSPVNVDEIYSSAFITTTNEGNDLTLTKWGVDWSIDGNRFTIDYGDIHSELSDLVAKTTDALKNKYRGDRAALKSAIDDVVVLGHSPDNPIPAIGTTSSDRLAFINNDLYIDGSLIAPHYEGLQSAIDTVKWSVSEFNDIGEKIDKIDVGFIDGMYDHLIPMLNDGYLPSDIVIDENSIFFEGKYVNLPYTRDDLINDLSEINFAGTIASDSNLSILEEKLGNLTISASDVPTINTTLTIGNMPMSPLLDALCITKELSPHSVSEVMVIPGGIV